MVLAKPASGETSMQLYDALAPNARAARMFLAEKGISIPTKPVDIMKAENRQPPYTDRNPGGQVPALELDNGKCLGETVAIFEYLEEKFPDPPLIGKTPEERAEARQWQRRVELNITEHVYNSFRYGEGIGMFKDRIKVIPEAAPALKDLVQDRLMWLDGQMDGNQYIVGDRFTIADIILYCALDFAGSVGRKLPDRAKWLPAWMQRVAARPSAATSLHPMAAKAKIRG
jgi:glutathione S-transferase